MKEKKEKDQSKSEDKENSQNIGNLLTEINKRERALT